MLTKKEKKKFHRLFVPILWKNILIKKMREKNNRLRNELRNKKNKYFHFFSGDYV